MIDALAGAAAAPAAARAAGVTPNDKIDQQQFLLLFIEQLKNQDPLAPLEPDQLTAQLAQFSSLEQLTGIRDRTKGTRRLNRMLAGWNFRELASFIEYKARLAGVRVIWVDPKGTSKTCPRCGHAARANRPQQGWFRCARCG